MQRKGLLTILGILILGLVGTLDDAFAEEFSSVSNGDWNSAATWQNEMNQPGIPGTADDKNVNHIVTISSPVNNSGRIQIGTATLIIDSTLSNTGFFDGFTTRGIINFGTITVTTNGIIQNNGLYDNIFGATTTIDSGGQFINNFASGNAHFHNEDGLVTVNGSLTNFGDIHQLLDGVITIGSTGSFFTIGSNAVTDNRPGSTINNSNIFDIETSGTLNNVGSSNINNEVGGTITITATLNNNGGTITNKNGAIVNIDSGGVIENNEFSNVTNENGAIINIDSGGVIENNESGTITNKLGGTVTNNGKITNKGEIDNFGTLNNDNYIENEKNVSNIVGGTIANTCLINNSGAGPSIEGVLFNDNTISNTGMIAVQPGGDYLESGTLNGNMAVKILEDEIIPEEDKIKGRIVVVTPDRHAKLDDEVGQLPLKGVKLSLTHSGGPTLMDSDRVDGNFSFDITTEKDTLTLTTILKDGSTNGFPDGKFEVHHTEKNTPVQFQTENFNSCILIAFLELSSTSPEFKLSGETSTPTLTGLSVLSRLADMAALYYYSFIGFDFIDQHLSEVTLDQVPLTVIGYSSDAFVDGSNFFRQADPSINMGTNSGGIVASGFATGSHTETIIDILYHEFGHYIMFESRIGDENDGIDTTRIIHPLLDDVITSTCHSGYAQIDSSCAWSEGFAGFMAGAIPDKMLIDTAHDKFTGSVVKYRGGSNNLESTFIDIFGFQLLTGEFLLQTGDEEASVAGLLWGLYSPSPPEPSVSIELNTLMVAFSNPALNPGNSEIITNISDLYTVMKNSGLISNPLLDKIFSNYKICVDTNANFTCDSNEVHGKTTWKNGNYTDTTGTTIVFGYPPTMGGDPRLDVPPFFPSMVGFDVNDLTGNTIMNGTEVTIETVLGEQKFSYTEIVYDGKLVTNFRIPAGGHANLIFSNDDFLPDSVTITSEQYYNGFGNDGEMNSLAFATEMIPKCIIETATDVETIISSTCFVTPSVIAGGSVTVQNGSVVIIPSGITLTVPPEENITIQDGGGVLIESGGTLQVNS